MSPTLYHLICSILTFIAQLKKHLLHTQVILFFRTFLDFRQVLTVPILINLTKKGIHYCLVQNLQNANKHWNNQVSYSKLLHCYKKTGHSGDARNS